MPLVYLTDTPQDLYTLTGLSGQVSVQNITKDLNARILAGGTIDSPLASYNTLVGLDRDGSGVNNYVVYDDTSIMAYGFGVELVVNKGVPITGNAIQQPGNQTSTTPVGTWLTDGGTIVLGRPAGINTAAGAQVVSVGDTVYTNVTSINVTGGTAAREQSTVIVEGDGPIELIGNIEGEANASWLIAEPIESFVLMFDGQTVRFSPGPYSEGPIGVKVGPAGQDGAGIVTFADVQTGPFTAALGTGYPLDLSGAAATSDTAITLPVGTPGESIIVYDQTRSLTSTRTAILSGARIESDPAGSLVLDEVGVDAVLTWRDAVYGYAVKLR